MTGRAGRTVSARLLAVSKPFRLDLTVAVLRRLSTNVVDVVATDGTYARVLEGPRATVLVTVRQADEATLVVEVDGERGTEQPAYALVERMLGFRRTTEGFDAAARTIPWLHPLAERMRGVKPPRYPSLWEACVNAIVFQQLSLVAAGAILRRTVRALSERLQYAGLELHAFPSVTTFGRASDALLRQSGLSAGKVATLRRVADALSSGILDEAMLEERDSVDAAKLLCSIKGIGAWTAAVILLRGLGRLDIFPANDSGAARALATLAGGQLDASAVLERLGCERGLLYYHLLLARLEARGELPAASPS